MTKPTQFPEPGIMCFGRIPSVTALPGTFWTAIQTETGRNSDVLLYRTTADNVETRRLRCSGNPYQPCIVALDQRTLFVAWNEVADRHWSLRCCTVDAETFAISETQILHASDKLLMGPSVTVYNGVVSVAWAERGDDAVGIRTAVRRENTWSVSEFLSAPDTDAFRPQIAALDDGRVFLAYDCYADGTYGVVLGELHDGRLDVVKTLSRQGERWLTPKILANGDTVYLLWIALREAEDDLGIRDHVACAMTGSFRDGEFAHLCNPHHPEDALITADLREGLLASEAYMGYHGLRRNPYFSVADDGRMWLFWEMRVEAERNASAARLVGRVLQGDNTWGPARELFDGENSYAVPSRFYGDRLPVAYLDREAEGERVVCSTFAPVSQGAEYRLDPTKWSRWRTASVDLPNKDRTPVRVGDRELRMFWADTHCHSVLCPDAEGEPDELIQFARDIAGLDAVCLVDNDFYPFKALTEPEWNTHEQLSAHYTEPGCFVVFPGWEFTFHRPDLINTMNHRTVFYPRPGGVIYRRIDAESDTDAKLLALLQETDAICYPHHMTYEITNPAVDRNVEIVSSWRVCMAESDFTLQQLLAGHRFGFIGSSDAHRANPGLGGAWTGVYAEELTPESLAEAYRARRLVATQGFPIFINFEVAGSFIGEEGECSGTPAIRAEIRAPRPIETIEVLRDGNSIHTIENCGDQACIDITDDDAASGTHFYFLQIKLVGDPSYNTDAAENSYRVFDGYGGRYPHNLARARGVFAWTSPIWVEVGK